MTYFLLSRRYFSTIKELTMLSDQEILKLYEDKNFMGSFSGVKNLKIFLKTDFNEDISTKRLYNILKKLPNYVQNLRRVRTFPRRPYDVDSFGKLLQMDLGFMKTYNVSKK